jgi:hypothetical protein
MIATTTIVQAGGQLLACAMQTQAHQAHSHRRVSPRDRLTRTRTRTATLPIN